MQVFKGLVPSPPKEFFDRMASVEAQLTANEKSTAQGIQAAWMTGKSPLTVEGLDGMRTLPALLASLER